MLRGMGAGAGMLGRRPDGANECLVVMLTGAPSCGKSTVAEQAAATVGCQVVDGDQILGRMFGLLPAADGRGFSGRISDPGAWSKLEHLADLGELFRLYHRDAVLGLDRLDLIVMPGWIYALRRWRALVYESFDGVPGITPVFHLVVLEPPSLRYAKQLEPNLGAADCKAAVAPARGTQQTARSRLKHFQSQTLELPTEEEAVSVRKVDGLPGLLQQVILRGVQGTDSAFRPPSRLVGCIDHVSPTGATGWAADLNRPKERVQVSLRCDGRLVGSGLADIYRPDVKDAGFGDGHYGFEIRMKPNVLIPERARFSLSAGVGKPAVRGPTICYGPTSRK